MQPCRSQQATQSLLALEPWVLAPPSALVLGWFELVLGAWSAEKPTWLEAAPEARSGLTGREMG